MVVARAGGFRDGARASGSSASSLSEAVRRLEVRLGVRLLNRTTRSVALTEAGARLAERLGPALGEVEAALDVVNLFRERPAGTLRLNVPISAAGLVLPAIVPPFLATLPRCVQQKSLTLLVLVPSFAAPQKRPPVGSTPSAVFPKAH
jgi:DNA-binding transcriptional LysR family regulator